MDAGITDTVELRERLAVFRHALGLEGLDTDQLEELACLAHLRGFGRGETIFGQSEPCNHFHVVAKGLVKVSICSASGTRITYLLAGRGEPLNLVGSFTGLPRFLSAEALEDTTLASVKREDFVAFALRHPGIIINIISILGNAIDSANGRIIDMMEKRVEQRLIKVLHTLYVKFGTPLRFTSRELAELTGTTTESTIRAMGQLRRQGIIRSGRGEICIMQPARLQNPETETLWV